MTWTLACALSADDTSEAFGQVIKTLKLGSPGRVERAGYWVLVVALVLTWVVMSAAISLSNGVANALPFVIGVGALCGFVIYAREPARQQRWTATLMVRFLRPPRSGRSVWIIDDEGVTWSWEPDPDRRFIRWSEVSSVLVTSDYVVLRDGTASRTAIPKRAFSSSDSIEEFVAYSNGRIDDNRQAVAV